MSAVTNILVVGTGGQGVLTAAELLARAAMACGHDVKKTEVAGMAQRGGVVSSQIRFGERIYSPQIGPGQAHLLVSFEAAEALRWSGYLQPAGVAVVNTLRIVPPVVTTGLYQYPQDPIATLAAAGIRLHTLDAGAIARELGNTKLVNTVMLGAVADHLPFPAQVLEDCLFESFQSHKPALAELNRRAFQAGRRA